MKCLEKNMETEACKLVLSQMLTMVNTSLSQYAKYLAEKVFSFRNVLKERTSSASEH